MCKSLNAAVNKCINCCFVHLLLETLKSAKQQTLICWHWRHRNTTHSQ